MARKKSWTKQKYRIALQGDGIPGLRAVIKGFAASDGYDLRKINEWTSSQKRRLRDYYAKVHLLEAQERRIVKPRNERNLRLLQDAFHGDIPSRQFKVAFVPYTDPKGLPGAKRKKPRISYLKGGIAIDAGPYRRLFVAFDKKKLVKNTDAELQRVFDTMPNARLFYVQTGEFQTLNGKDRRFVTQQVKKWMEQYDGRRELPRTSGNRGDSPKHHHHKYWLNGLVGYEFPKELDTMTLQRQIVAGMAKSKKKRAEQDKKMKSKRKR